MYVTTQRRLWRRASRACGVEHPGLVTMEHFDLLDEAFTAIDPRERFKYQPGWGEVSEEQAHALREIMAGGGRP